MNTAPTPRRRHAAAAVAEWAAVSGAGARPVEEVGKHQLMRRTGLPARDLRALDSSYPSTSSQLLTARDRAVVVNLERARAVITAAEVLIPGPRDPAVAPLVRDLRARLTSSPPPQDISPSSPGGDQGAKDDGQALGIISDKVLPFEFRALEVCLQFACKSLEHETSALEEEAYPALDELTSIVSALNLERVRQIKSRLVAISGRVHKVRDELEHLLDDDTDMAAMHLTEKLAYQAASRSSRFNSDKEPSEFYDERVDEEGVEEGERSSEGGNGDEASVGFTPKIDELENLLEAYFVQIEGTLNKLTTLREYVNDTEDYINIMLDDKQNQLLQMGIALSTGTLVITGAVVVTGVFGMNIHIPLFRTANMALFWQVTGGMVGASAAIFLVALLCYRRSGILQ